jgi:hypothetical protein
MRLIIYLLLALSSLVAPPCQADEPPQTDVVVPAYANSFRGATSFWSASILVTNTSRAAGKITIAAVYPNPGFSPELIRLNEMWDIPVGETVDIYPVAGIWSTPFAGSLRVQATVPVRVETLIFSEHYLPQFVPAVQVTDLATSAVIPCAPLGINDPRVNVVIVSPSLAPNRVRIRMIFTLTGEVVHDDIEYLGSGSTIVRAFRPRVPMVFDGFGGTYRIELSSDFPILCGASMFRGPAASYIPCIPMPDLSAQPAAE